MNRTDRRLVVVLGMHRSGTSAVTRGLPVAGVGLGDRLMPAIEGVNDKGFWEDLDVYELNREMLNSLGSDWHHLSRIKTGDVESLRAQGYLLRATELIRMKLDKSPIFGLKDPRLAKLLPFWNEVFKHCDVDLNYIIAIRNPLSVARSLKQRDSFCAEKSYLLWLDHVINSLIGSAGGKRVVIDYDLLMKSPEHELSRMARRFDLTLNSEELKKYKTEFLDNSLRHSVFGVSDLSLDSACPPSVHEIYRVLLDVASDRVQVDDPMVAKKAHQWAHEFEGIESALRLADTLEARIKVEKGVAIERDGQIASLGQAVGERDAQIASLGQAVSERDAQIASLGQAVGERDAQIASLSQAVNGRRGPIAGLSPAENERRGQIAGLSQAVSERDGQIANLSQAMAERDGRIASLSQAVAERDGRITSLSQAVAECDGRITSLSQSVAERDGRITSLSQAVAECDGRITSLSQAVAERDGQIASLSQAVAERDGRIASLNQAVAERDGRIADLFRTILEREGEIANLDQTVAERDEQIRYLSHSLAESECRSLAHQGQISALEQTVASHQQRNLEYNCHVAELEKAVGAAQQHSQVLSQERELYKNQVALLVQSRSWRLTAPLRQLSAVKLRWKNALSKMPVSAFRALPMRPDKKQKVKHYIFRYFGFAFRHFEAYQRWAAFQKIQTNWAPPIADTAASSAIQTPSPASTAIASPPLLAANGSWEWQDYAPVKERIAQVTAARRERTSPKPFDMIDIQTAQLKSIASDLRLPEVVPKPDVSIIVPVFNNVKLTLECLLSIAEHAESVPTFEVIVADDASTDDTAEVIPLIANIRYIRNEENLGFLRNCNRALPEVNGSYVVYLNNDVQVTAGWLTALLKTFDSHEKVGAVGPRFVYPSGHLQEAGVTFMPDGTAAMTGLNEDPNQPRYSYIRRVDYVSGACLMLPTPLAKRIGGFSEEFLPCYCEDADLCLSVRDAGLNVYYNPEATIIHHLSKSTASVNNDFKMRCISKNFSTLQRKWSVALDRVMNPRLIAFYLPQFHPIPENDQWWGKGFTEWTNVSKAQPNFVGHYQPRIPADLGYYDLRLMEVMQQQADLAQRYGVHGFCYYYYWFNGRRLLERPVEQLLRSDKPDLPFCLCWANENWTRRWDGQEHEILMAQAHTVEDDEAVINDLIRFFRDSRYIKVDGRPLILVYRVTLFPDFAATASRWRQICREQGVGEIYIAMVESFELVHSGTHPSKFGCDAAVEFPPQGLAEQKQPAGEILNSNFKGSVADYRDLAVRYATREAPAYTRFKGVMPGWDNTARRQDTSFCFENATPGAFQGWLEEAIDETRRQNFGDERIVFVNAWNEWAEGAYLEPDRRFGHSYLEAVKNASDAGRLLKRN